METATLGGAC